MVLGAGVVCDAQDPWREEEGLQVTRAPLWRPKVRLQGEVCSDLFQVEFPAYLQSVLVSRAEGLNPLALQNCLPS